MHIRNISDYRSFHFDQNFKLLYNLVQGKKHYGMHQFTMSFDKLDRY